MKPAIAVIVLLLPATAWAQPLPVPRVGGPGGGCPAGYSWQGSYCIPLSDNSPVVIPKKGTTCPSGRTASGAYCVKI